MKLSYKTLLSAFLSILLNTALTGCAVRERVVLPSYTVQGPMAPSASPVVMTLDPFPAPSYVTAVGPASLVFTDSYYYGGPVRYGYGYGRRGHHHHR